MNKAELIERLSVRLGDKRSAAEALEAVLAEIQAAVTKGEKVSITGFGVFEKRVRAARMARNPRTGEAVRVKKTSVPAFRPGAGFKETVASGRVPKALKAPAKKAAAPAKKAAAKKAAAKKVTKVTAARKAPAKKVAKAAPARKTAARATAARGRATTARKAPAKRAAKKATRRGR